MVVVAGLFYASVPAFAAPISLLAASDFYIPRPASASDQVGVRRLLAVYDLAENGYADLIGIECTFTITAANGDSVHPNNFGVIVTGDDESDILETESEPNVTTTRLEDETLVLGPTIELYNVMLPDEDDIVATSVDYEVFVDCEPETTTTTQATTTTTEATTTTTEPTTTTTAPTTSSSTVLGTTTTTLPTTSTSAEATSSSTTVPQVTASTLPFTGPPVETAGWLMAATALFLLGGGALLAARDS